MKFGIYLPDGWDEKTADKKMPVLFWLSGITCTEENFIIKSGMQRFASAHQIVVVNPDTSPRGVVTGLGDDDPNFGAAAGFYLDATEPRWANNYRMYSYIVQEFVPLIFAQFPVADQNRCSLFGHSMGGHGALTIGMKHPELFHSLSVFAPICNPVNASAYGRRYFTAYLGADNEQQWAQYDATELAKTYRGPRREVLIDQGSADPILLSGDLMPERLLAVHNPNLVWKYRVHESYDHGYFFIHTFIEDHFLFHIRCWAEEEKEQKSA